MKSSWKTLNDCMSKIQKLKDKKQEMDAKIQKESLKLVEELGPTITDALQNIYKRISVDWKGIIEQEPRISPKLLNNFYDKEKKQFYSWQVNLNKYFFMFYLCGSNEFPFPSFIKLIVKTHNSEPEGEICTEDITYKGLQILFYWKLERLGFRGKE